VDLTPDERRRIYEEEKARLTAAAEVKAAEEARRRGESRAVSSKATIGCLGCFGLLIIIALVANISSQFAKTTESGSGPAGVAGGSEQALGKSELLRRADIFKVSLDSMNVAVAGTSIEHIGLVLEVFNNAAQVIQRAQAEELGPEEMAHLSALRSALVRRQRQAFPLMRDRMGAILDKKLWIADGSARTFGKRDTGIDFVSGTYAANANIQRDYEAFRPTLVRLRFKRAQYRWYKDADEYNYYKIESPFDDDVAIISEEGAVTNVPENR